MMGKKNKFFFKQIPFNRFPCKEMGHLENISFLKQEGRAGLPHDVKTYFILHGSGLTRTQCICTHIYTPEPGLEV